MKGKPIAKPNPNQEAIPDLAQLLGDDTATDRFDYGGVDWDALGALITVATSLGALVSLYISSGDGSLVISLRLGDTRKAYSAPDPDTFSGLCRGLTAKLSPGLRKLG